MLIAAVTPTNTTDNNLSINADFTIPLNPVCLGSSVTITDASTGTGMATWFWSFGSGASISSFTGQVPPTITYATPGIKSITLTVLDNNNIPYSTFKTITVNGVIANAGTAKNYCLNSLPGVQLGASAIGTAAYSWNPTTNLSNANSSSPIATPSATTTYILSVSDNGCTTTDQVIVTVLSAANVNAGRDTLVCGGASVAIGENAQAGFSYAWNPTAGLSNPSIANPSCTPTTNTVYTLIGTAPNGCIAYDQVAVNTLGVISASVAGATTICFGNAAAIGAANKPFHSYTWTPAIGLSSSTIANPVASPTATTTYQLTVNALNCTATDSVVVTVNPLPIVNLGANDTVNTCNSVPNTLGGAPVVGNSYLWSPATFLTATNTASVTAVPANDITYYLSIRDANNCVSTDSVFVHVYTTLSAHAGLDQTICFGNSIALGGTSIISNGGSGNYIYSWTPSATLGNASIAHPLATPNDTTTYILTVVDAAGSNCGRGEDTVVVFVNPLPHPTLSFKTVYCTGDAPEPLIANPSGGTFYLKLNPTNFVVLNNNLFNPNSALITVGIPYTITYSYTTPQGCTYDTSQSVIVFATPIADAGSDAAICPVGGYLSSTLQATGGSTCTWSPSAGLSSNSVYNPIANPAVITIYVLKFTSMGCVDKNTVWFRFVQMVFHWYNV